MADLNIILQGFLAKETEQNINKQLEEIQGKLKSLDIKINIEDGLIKNVSDKLKNLASDMGKVADMQKASVQSNEHQNSRLDEFNRKMEEQRRIIQQAKTARDDLIKNETRYIRQHFEYLQQLEKEHNLRQKILDQGGLRIPGKGDDMYGEYQGLDPRIKRDFFRKESKISPDQMADILGLSNVDELFQKLNRYYDEARSKAQLWSQAIKDVSEDNQHSLQEFANYAKQAEEAIGKLKAEYADVIQAQAKLTEESRKTAEATQQTPEDAKWDKMVEQTNLQTGELVKRTTDYTSKLGESVRIIEQLNDETKQLEATTEILTNNRRKDQEQLEKMIRTLDEFRRKATQQLDELSTNYLDGDTETKKIAELRAQIEALNAASGSVVEDMHKLKGAVADFARDAKQRLEMDTALAKSAQRRREEAEKLQAVEAKIANKQMEQTAQLERQIKVYQARQHHELDQLLNSKVAGFVDVSEVDALRQRIDALSATSVNAKDDMAQLTFEIVKLKDAAGNASQVSEVLGKLHAQLTKIEMRYQGSIDKTRLEELQLQLKAITLETPGALAQLRAIKTEMDKLELDAKSRGLDPSHREGMNWQQWFTGALNKFAIWMGASTVFYQSFRFFQNGIRYVNELNQALTEISIVTNRSQAEVEKLGHEYQKLAYEMGVATKQVAEASVTFYRQGLNQEEVMERVRTATQLAKIANIEFGEASEIITSITNGLGVSAQRAADALIQVGDSTATSASEIGRAIQKVSGTAGALGIEFEMLVAQISTISARTRESAESIGTSLKTIFQRMVNMREAGFDEEDGTRINDVAKALATVDISIVDTAGNFRDLGIVLGELGQKWESLDSRTRSYISTAMAGTRQASRFQTLMEGHSETMKMYESALGSAGTAQEKYNRYLQSTEAYLNRLRTTATGIWQHAFKSEEIRNAIGMLTGLLNVISLITKNLGLLSPVLSTAVLGMAAFNAKFREFGHSIGASFIRSIQSVVVAIKAKSAAAITGSISFTALSVAVKSAATSFGIFLASVAAPLLLVNAIAWAISSLTGTLVRNAQAQRELNQANEQSMLSWSNHGEEVSALIDKYKELSEISEKHGLNAEQHQEFVGVQNELNRLMPVLTSHIDNQGNAHLKNVAAIEAEIEVLRRLKQEQSAVSAQQLEQSLDRVISKLGTIGREIERLSKPTTSHFFDEDTGRYIEQPETIEQQINRERRLAQAKRDHVEVLNELLPLIRQDVKHRLEAVGITASLTAEEERYIDSLARENAAHLNNAKAINEFTKDIIGLIRVRNQLNATIEDTNRHLNIEQTSISIRLSQLGVEIDLTKQLTEATKNLAREQIRAKWMARAANNPRGGEMSIGMAKDMLKELADLEEIFKRIDEQWKSVNQTVRGTTPGGSSSPGSSSPAAAFAQAFDLSRTKLEAVNAEIERLRDNLEIVIELEAKKEVYDQLIETYRHKQQILQHIRAMQLQQLEDAKDLLASFVASGKLSSTVFDQIINGEYTGITITNKELSETINLVQRLTSAVQDSDNALRDVSQAMLSAQESMARQIEQMADQVINAYKDMYRQQREMQLKAIREQISEEQKRHRQVMDNLREELRAFEEVINTKLREIDREESESDYQKRLAQAQAERSELQRQIDLLSMDDSMEARARVSDLRERLANKDIEIAEMQHKHEVNLRKDNLRDQLEDYRKDVEARRDAETAKFEALKESLDRQLEEWEVYYDNLLNNERMWAKMRKDIIEGNFDEVLQGLQEGVSEFSKVLLENMDDAGRSIQENLIDKLASAIDMLNSVKGMSFNMPSVPRTPSTTPTYNYQAPAVTLREYVSARKPGMLVDWDAATGTVTVGNKKYTVAELLAAGLVLKNGYWQGNVSALRNLLGFKSGGYTGEWSGDSGRLALLHKKELVLNEKDTMNFLTAVRLLRSLIPDLKAPTFAPAMAGVGGTTIHMPVHIGSLTGDEKGAKQFFGIVNKELKKRGL